MTVSHRHAVKCSEKRDACMCLIKEESGTGAPFRGPTDTTLHFHNKIKIK